MPQLKTDPAAALNLVLWGDPQLASLHPEREDNFKAACKTVAAAEGPLDALVILGDVAEFGRATEYAAVQRHLTTAAEKAEHIFCVPGNHDLRVRHFGGQRARFASFLSGIPHAVPNPRERYWFSYELNGYLLLFLGADKTCFEGSYLSPAQLRWLSEKLDEAKATNKPAFVFNHQPLKRSNGLPVTWGGVGTWRGSVGDQNDALRAILKKHGDVVYITGHLHYGVSRYNLENSGRLHMLNVPSVGCANHGKNDAPAQGYLLSVHPDKLVGSAILFRTGEEMDETIPNARFEIPLTTA